MFFLLATLNVAYIVSTPTPKERKDEMVEHVRKWTKWDNDDFIC